MRGMWCVNSSPPTLDISLILSHNISPLFHLLVFTNTHTHRAEGNRKHMDVNHTFGGITSQVKGAAEWSV